MASSSDVGSLVAKLMLDISDFSKNLGQVEKSLSSLDALKLTGKAFAGLGAGATASAVLFSKAATDFESSFAGVKKTVEAPIGADVNTFFAGLENDIRSMAKEMPASVHEIASVYEAAGQLGIASEDLTVFSRAMIDVGNSTNLSSQKAAKTFAQFANITGMSQKEFSNLGSSLVDLGNNMATTESDISDMAFRLAGAGSQAKMSEADILGISAAFSSIGVSAEVGGTAISKLISDMGQSVVTGAGHLDTFAEVAGMTANDFQKAFERDSAGAFAAFIAGLGDISKAGGNVYEVLDRLNIGEQRMIDTLLRASGAGDLLEKGIALSNKAWKENVALSNEAGKRYATVASQCVMVKNQLYDIAITLGQALLPGVIALIEWVTPLIAKFSEWATQNSELIANLLKIGILLGFVGVAILGVMKVVALVKTIIAVVGTLGTALTPILPILFAVTAAVLLFKTAYEHNFLGIRDITDSTVHSVVEYLESLKATFTEDGWRGVFSKIGSDILTGFDVIFQGIKEKVQAWLGDISEAFVATDWTTLAGTVLAGVNSVFGAVVDGVYDFVGEAIKAGMDMVANMFGFENTEAVVEGAKKMIADVAAAFVGWWDKLKQSVEEVINGVTGFFKKLFDDLVGHSIVPDMIAAVVTAFAGWWGNIKPAIEEVVNGIKSLWNGLIAFLESSLNEMLLSLPRWIKSVFKIDDSAMFDFSKLKFNADSGEGAKAAALSAYTAISQETIDSFMALADALEAVNAEIALLVNQPLDLEWFPAVSDDVLEKYGEFSYSIGRIGVGMAAIAGAGDVFDPKFGKFKVIGDGQLSSYAALADEVNRIVDSVERLSILANVFSENGQFSGITMDVVERYNGLGAAIANIADSMERINGVNHVSTVIGKEPDAVSGELPTPETAGGFFQPISDDVVTSFADFATLIERINNTIATINLNLGVGGTLISEGESTAAGGNEAGGEAFGMMGVLQAIALYINEDFTIAFMKLEQMWKTTFIPTLLKLVETVSGGDKSLLDALKKSTKQTNELRESFVGLNTVFTVNTPKAIETLIPCINNATDVVNKITMKAQNATQAFMDWAAAIYAVINALDTLAAKNGGDTRNAGGYYDGERAIGGSVQRGGTYLVGEEGPELFTARANGYIVPNDELRGGEAKESVVINFNGEIFGREYLKEEIAASVLEGLEQAAFYGS